MQSDGHVDVVFDDHPVVVIIKFVGDRLQEAQLMLTNPRDDSRVSLHLLQLLKS